jgi:hypothetical protein
MPSQEYVDKKKEEFRFYDDLAPEVRKVLREAFYEWNPIKVMSSQHEYYQNGLTMDDLASIVKERDQDLFISRTVEKFRVLDESSSSNS